jgi:hypothetical protein
LHVHGTNDTVAVGASQPQRRLEGLDVLQEARALGLRAGDLGLDVIGAHALERIMRRPRRTDGNHATIRDTLRRCGCVVEDLSDVGRGIPDLLVLTPKGRVLLVEVKDGSQPPSKQRLTEEEVGVANRWTGHYLIVTSVDDAIRAARL